MCKNIAGCEKTGLVVVGCDKIWPGVQKYGGVEIWLGVKNRAGCGKLWLGVQKYCWV